MVKDQMALKKRIFEKIREYGTIVITRHRRPDGDAIGSTYGLYRILRATYPEKKIFLDNSDASDYLAFMGGEGERPTDGECREALFIVLDTGTFDRISSKRAALAKETVKIDHHIDDMPYGNLSLVEDWRSSTCEMIVDLWEHFKDEWIMDSDAASCLFVGMVTDSGRFRYPETSPESMRKAAVLLEKGVDKDRIYANLYMEDFDTLRADASLTSKIRMTGNGVAYLYVSRAMRLRRKMTPEQASNTVELMKKIRNSLIWLAFIDNDDGSIRVRLRSRFVEVQPLATRYHGGGHACAAGATVYSKDEMDALLRDADDLLGEYKKTHEGWL